MKKLFLIGAFLFGIVAMHNAYSGCCGAPCGAAPCAPACAEPCQPACPPDQALNECYCLYVHYEPCYYTTKRCVEECIPYTRRCCRTVPKYHEVQRCRMVPQYYTETVCCPELEYYDVQETRTCKKVICEPQCKYVPKYYWKHSCGDVQQGCCAPAGCP